MAIYGCRVKIVGRSQGHSAVAGAAYRARAELTDARTGQRHDYTRAYGGTDLAFAGIYAPENAPAWARDRQRLWDAVEAAETRKDSQLAREFQVDLPHELTEQQNRWLVQDFVKENFTRKGYVADVAIHRAHEWGDARNVHAHIMTTTRAVDENGFVAMKDETTNSKAQLREWRESWAKHLAHHLERHGFEKEAVRMVVGHLTLPRQQAEAIKRGDLEWAKQLDRLPQIHFGKAAAAMERRGVETDKGDTLREIAAVNNHDMATDDRHALQGLYAATWKPSPLDNGTYNAMRTTHQAVAADREGELAAVREAMREAWSDSQGGALEFAIALGDRGLSMAETKRGRFVAVDSRGDWHPLAPEILGKGSEDVQARLAAQFGKDADIHLPTTAELRDALRAESAGHWRTSPNPDHRGEYHELSAERTGQHQHWMSERAEFRSQLVDEQRAKLADNHSVQGIKAAWQDMLNSEDARLADTLRARGLILSRVTDEDAAQSRQEQIAAQLRDEKPARAWQAGQFIAVNQWGNAYALNEITVHAAAEDIRAHFAYLDSTGAVQPSLANARLYAEESRLLARENWRERHRQERADALGKLEDVQTVRDLWRQSDSAAAFIAGTEAQGLVIGRADEWDAFRSHYSAEVARSRDPDTTTPIYKVDELVIFTPRGLGFRLDSATLDDTRAADRLATAAHVALPSLEEAREIVWQAQPERETVNERAPRVLAETARAADRAASAAEQGTQALGEISGMAEKALTGLVEFFFGGIGHARPAREASSAPTAAYVPSMDTPAPSQARRVAEASKRADKSLGGARDLEANHGGRLMQLDPEIQDALRRAREAKERDDRERDDDERDRDR